MVLRSRKVRRFPYLCHALAQADYQALASKPGWQARSIEVAPGIRLRGLLRPPTNPNSPGPWILFFNGNSGTMLQESQTVLSGLAPEPTWGEAVFAYRGYDGSDGKPDPQALSEDAWNIYQALLRDEKLSPSSVHLVGFSLGTSLVAAVAARAHDRPPASVTLLAPMTQLNMGEKYQLFLDRYETTKYLDSISGPVLVVHGADDATLPVEYGRAVASQLGDRARLVILPGHGHLDLLSSPTAAQTVRAFIVEHSHAAAQ